MPASPSPRANRAASLRVLLSILILSLVFVFMLTAEIERVRAFIQGSGWVGIILSIALYAVLGASPIPSEPLTVLNSTISGPFTAMLVAATGNTFAALVEYYIGIKLSDVTGFEQRRANLPFRLGQLPVASPIFLILSRNLPGYGPKFVSLLAGAYRVPLWRFVWTTLVVNLAGAAVFAYGGFELLRRIFP